MARRAVRLALVLTLVACGSTGGLRRGNSTVVTRDEIAASSANTAYELLQQLRPQFLRSRGVVSVQNPRPVYAIVYMNDVRHGNLESLRSITVDEIEEIRFLNSADATTRWGTGHTGGVIHVLARH